MTETDGGGRAHRLRLRCPAVLAELRTVRRRVQRWARGHGLPEGVLVDLQLAVGEAVSNGIEHAYRAAAGGRSPAPPSVDVELELRAGDQGPLVAARVIDHGRWRPAPADPGYRGRGLALIRRLSRDVRVLPSGHGTQVSFAIPVASR